MCGRDDAPHRRHLNGLSALTGTMWVKPASTGTDKGVLISRTSNGKDLQLGLRYARRGSGRGAPRDHGRDPVRILASDEGSRLESARFPAVFGATDGTTILLQGPTGPETVVLDRLGNETRGPAFHPPGHEGASGRRERTAHRLREHLVSWTGDDGGGAGTRSFDVEVKEAGAAAWTARLSETTSLQGRYREEPERSYVFRVRATDRVGNRGGWAEGGPVPLREVQLRKYYSLGDARVAVRRDDELFYIHGDHLGSTSLVLDEAGAIVSAAALQRPRRPPARLSRPR